MKPFVLYTLARLGLFAVAAVVVWLVAGLPELTSQNVLGIILVALIILCTLLAFLSPVFFTTDNLLGVARAFSLTAIAAIGQTMVIISGGIDLSAGSIIGLSSLSTGLLLVNGWPSVPAILAGIAVGTAFGVCNARPGPAIPGEHRTVPR